MSSGYFAGKDSWWVSNGSAELLNANWARRIRSRGAHAQHGAGLVALLDQRVEMNSAGMLGFDFVTEVSADARPILRTAIEDFAREFAAATQGAIEHDDLTFIARLEPGRIAWWMATHYALHALIVTAMGESLALDLGLPADLECAARGLSLTSSIQRLKSLRHVDAEVEVRRRQLDHWLVAGAWISVSEQKRALYELADLEERVGAFDASARHTEQAAAFEEDAMVRATALEIAAQRRGSAVIA